MNKPVRLLIADNDQNFAVGLKSFLGNCGDIQVLETVRDGQGTVMACRENLPDLLLIDLHLPVLDSINTIHQILLQNDRIKILTTSAINNDRYAIEAIKAGAQGYIEKNGSNNFDEILAALRQVASGEVVLNSTLALYILQEFS